MSLMAAAGEPLLCSSTLNEEIRSHPIDILNSDMLGKEAVFTVLLFNS